MTELNSSLRPPDAEEEKILEDNEMKWFNLFLTILILGANRHLLSQEIDARVIMDRSLSATRLAGVEAVSTMTIVDSKGRERVRKIAQVTKLYDDGKTEKKLIRFLSPADVKGTGLLTWDYDDKDDDMWLYMPALRKTRRIVSSEKAKSFMGSEFSYADINPPTLDDFDFRLLGEETVGGVPCHKIQMTPKDDDIADENGFTQRVSWVGKEDYVVRQSEYTDFDGELFKRLTVNEVRLIDPEHKKYRIIDMVMENLLDDRRSMLVIDQIQFNPQVGDEYFTARYLERQ